MKTLSLPRGCKQYVVDLPLWETNKDAMYDKFRPGDVVYVKESAPVKEGDYVLVRRTDGLAVEKMAMGLIHLGRVMRHERWYV